MAGLLLTCECAAVHVLGDFWCSGVKCGCGSVVARGMWVDSSSSSMYVVLCMYNSRVLMSVAGRHFGAAEPADRRSFPHCSKPRPEILELLSRQNRNSASSRWAIRCKGWSGVKILPLLNHHKSST